MVLRNVFFGVYPLSQNNSAVGDFNYEIKSTRENPSLKYFFLTVKID